MTTVTQLIEYLENLPGDTEVSVLYAYDCGYSTCVDQVDLDLDPINGNVDFTDFTGNTSVKEGDDLFNKKFLLFGEI